MKTILMIMILLIPTICFADEQFTIESGEVKHYLIVTPENKNKWDKADTLREITWQALHFIDYGQTLDIARKPYRYEESNPILGKHPSVGRVHTYMIASAILHFGISYALPDKWREAWQYITIGISGGMVVSNFSAGVRVSF